MDLTEATCVVTGAGSMIGTATVAELLACGATVVAVDAVPPAVDGARSIAADVATPEGRALVFDGRPTRRTSSRSAARATRARCSTSRPTTGTACSRPTRSRRSS